MATPTEFVCMIEVSFYTITARLLRGSVSNGQMYFLWLDSQYVT